MESKYECSCGRFKAPEAETCCYCLVERMEESRRLELSNVELGGADADALESLFGDER